MARRKQNKRKQETYIEILAKQLRTMHNRSVQIIYDINSKQAYAQLHYVTKQSNKVYIIVKCKNTQCIFNDNDSKFLLLFDGHVTVIKDTINPRIALCPSKTTCLICMTENVPLERRRSCTNCNELWCIICQMKMIAMSLKKFDNVFNCPYCRDKTFLTDGNYNYQLHIIALKSLINRVENELFNDNITEEEANNIVEILNLGIKIEMYDEEP